jgi:hypothetical protein
VSHTVILDNAAVQALSSASHPKHNKVVSHLQVVASRKRKAGQVSIVVPTSVRVEAGWDRTDVAWAFANRLGIGDAELAAAHANAASAIRGRIGTHISVVDANIGSVIQSSTTKRISVITSDPDDMKAVAETKPVVIITI